MGKSRWQNWSNFFLTLYGYNWCQHDVKWGSQMPYVYMYLLYTKLVADGLILIIML